MTDAMLGALFLNFSATVGASTTRAGRAYWSPVTYEIAGLVLLTGTVAGFLAIFLFFKDQGFGFGLLYWTASAAAYTFICNWVLS